MCTLQTNKIGKSGKEDSKNFGPFFHICWPITLTENFLKIFSEEENIFSKKKLAKIPGSRLDLSQTSKFFFSKLFFPWNIFFFTARKISLN